MAEKKFNKPKFLTDPTFILFLVFVALKPVFRAVYTEIL